MVKLHTVAVGLGATLLIVSACSDDGGVGGEPDAAPDVFDAMMVDASVDALGGTCRSSAECSPDEGCVGPNDVFCGVPPQEGCMDAGECGPGSTCHVIPDSCSADGFGSECGPLCNPGDVCGDNMECNPDGACRPLACDQPAVDCRPSEVCDPASIDPAGPVHGIDRGCENITCADDGPCPTGAVCVNGYCQDGPGMCSPPAA